MPFETRERYRKEGKCWFCHNAADHTWETCPQFLATSEGKKYKGKVQALPLPTLNLNHAVHALTRHDRKLSPDKDDRMILPSEFKMIQEKCGMKFTIDACCDPDGLNKLVDKHYSKRDSFLNADVTGNHVWIHPPARRAHEFIMHYRRCKRRSPCDTSACILVPVYFARSRKGKYALRDMQRLHEFPVGHSLLTGRELHGNGRVEFSSGIPCGMQVWFDPVKPAAKLHVLSPGRMALTMQFGGVLAGTSVKVLLDSGATDNFIARELAEKLRLPIDDCGKQALQLPDGRRQELSGRVSCLLRIGSYYGRVPLYVADLPGFDVILGEPWLRQQHAHLDYRAETPCCVIRKGLKRVTLKPLIDTRVAGGSDAPCLLTALQFKRACKGADELYAMMLRSDPDHDDGHEQELDCNTAAVDRCL